MDLQTQKKIAELHQKTSCPTETLLCIATGIKPNRDSTRWREQIQEQAGTTSDFFIDMNNAVIFGRYPELKAASDYFKDKIYKFRHQLGQENPAAPITEIDKQLQSQMSEISQDTATRFSLKRQYSFTTPLNAEQEVQINNNLREAHKKSLDYCKENHLPETNIVHNALRSSIKDLNLASSVQLMENMEYLDGILRAGPEKLAKIQYTAQYAEYAELHNMAAKVFDMQKRGIDFSNPEAVKNSPEMQNISYKGKQYDLSTKISPDNNLSQNQPVNG